MVEIEEGAVEHMNADHADAVRLYATKLLGEADGAWRVTGVDPDGLDLALGDRIAADAVPDARDRRQRCCERCSPKPARRRGRNRTASAPVRNGRRLRHAFMLQSRKPSLWIDLGRAADRDYRCRARGGWIVAAGAWFRICSVSDQRKTSRLERVSN